MWSASWLRTANCWCADRGFSRATGSKLNGYARQVIDAEGWFATGDIARDRRRRIPFITDRKKELLKTSGGKLIAPQPIEGKLKTNVLVAQAALVGDKHKFAPC
jgi:long-subunit acyl-CoA synthetase (AMP-forming)